MVTTGAFVDKDIIISQVTYAKVNWEPKPTSNVIFTWKCDYWASSRRDLRESVLARDTSILFKDVVIEEHVNTVVIGDMVELFDINWISIGSFIIYELDKFRSLWGDIDNTLMKVSTRKPNG